MTETANKFAAENITIDKDAIYIDGHKIDGHLIAQGAHIHWGGENKVGPALTITVIAEHIDITDQARDWKNNVSPEAWTESGKPASVRQGEGTRRPA